MRQTQWRLFQSGPIFLENILTATHMVSLENITKERWMLLKDQSAQLVLDCRDIVKIDIASESQEWNHSKVWNNI